MNGTLWNPAATLRQGLRVATLVMLCLWARPVLGEVAPPAEAAPAPSPAPSRVSPVEATAAPSATPRAENLTARPSGPEREASRSVQPAPSGDAQPVAAATAPPEGGAVEGPATGDAPADAAAAGGEGASGNPLAGEPPAGTSPVDDAFAAAERAAESDLADMPAWRPEGIDAEEEDVGASAGAMLLRTVIVLGVVLAAIYLTLNVGLRRLMGLSAVGGRGSNALLQVVERHPVGPRHALLVVRAGDDHLVVSQSEGQMNLISRIEPAQVAAHAAARAEAPAASGPVLSPFLQKLLARRGEPVQSPDPAPPPPSTPPSA